MDKPLAADGKARVALLIDAPDLMARIRAALDDDPTATIRHDPREQADLIIADRDPGSGKVIALVQPTQSAVQWSADVRAALPSDAPDTMLRAAVHAVAAGLAVVPAASFRGQLPELPSHALAPRTNELTPRERQVLELLVTGESNKRIARRLGISVPTVKFHVAAILTKLGAHGRAEAIVIAFRRGLVML